jgi:hypothetical protein
LEGIEIALTERIDPRSQLKSWSGTFTAPEGIYFEPGQYYDLQLKDGRTGSFFISGMRLRSGIPDSIEFVGSGDLK